MFSGWRVRIVCLAVSETVTIPAEEFEHYSPGASGEVPTAAIPIMGKRYEFEVLPEGVVIRRSA